MSDLLQWVATGLAIVARTILGGFALVNGTPTIVSWTAPNDGNMHLVLIGGSKVVTAAETGGQIVVRYTSGGVALVLALVNANQGVGGFTFNQEVLAVDPGTTVNVNQNTALTAGASTVNAVIAAA